MKIIITESQYRLLIENESETEIFLKKYLEKYGNLPIYSELEQLRTIKVGDIYPEHSRANSPVSSWIKNYAPDFNQSILKISDDQDIIFKNNKGGGRYISFDRKHRFESKFESIFYNIFALEGLQDKLTYGSNKFREDCQKKPDFIWEDKKIVFEIGGMEDEKYWKNLERAKQCIESKGYDVIIFNTRKDQKKHNFVEFYIQVCEACGFEIQEEVVDDITIIMKLTEFTKQQRQEEIDKLINKFDRTRGQTDRLINYLRQLGYEGIKDYKEKNDLGRFQTSESGIRKKVVELLMQKTKIDDIAKSLSVAPSYVDTLISKAKELGEIPKDFSNKSFFDAQRRKDNYPSRDELKKLLDQNISWVQLGKMYGVSNNAMKKRAKTLGLID